MRWTTVLTFLPLLSVGCSYTTLEAPNLPNPVTLGPIDRVGGHRAGGEVVVGKVSAVAIDYASVSRETEQIGDIEVTTTRTFVLTTGSNELSERVLRATEGRADRDVRIDELRVSGWVLIGSGVASADRTIAVDGRVVEVAHAR